MTFEIQKRVYGDPLHEIEKLQEAFSQILGGTSLPRWGDRNPGLFESVWGPAVDIYESKDDVIVRADIPGMKKEDIEISIQDDILVLKGERKAFEESEDHANLRTERSYGVFSRAFTLPAGVDTSKAAATYREGVLELKLPKNEESKPKEIHVAVK